MADDKRRPAEARETGRRRSLRLMIWSGAAIMAVYGVGWAHTEAAAQAAAAPVSSTAAPLAGSPVAGGGPSAVGAAPTGGYGGYGDFGGDDGGFSGRRGDGGFRDRFGGFGGRFGRLGRDGSSGSLGPGAVYGGGSTGAAAPAQSPPAGATGSSASYRDGTYAGTGEGAHGPISVDVSVQGGRVASVQITSCGTRYPCSWIAALPGEVVAAQSVDVDMVSGATASSQAFLGAVAQALSKAK